MALTAEEKGRLSGTARRSRRAIVELVFASGSGRVGTALGRTDLARISRK